MGRSIWFVRHGHRQDFAYPEWFETAPRRYDPPLSKQGFEQVNDLARRLAREKVDHLFCSPFLRAIQTAYPIAIALNLEIKLEKGLGEWLNPEWMTEYPETEPEASLRKNHPIDGNYHSLLLPIYPETEAEMMARMGKIIELLLEQFTGNLLLVGHRATVESGSASLLGKNIILTAPVASLTQLVYEQGQWQLKLGTDTSFLDQ